ncbi:MAG: DEAD/DEAH box helicase family protein [Lachnospiraceae bacterium]|nr:DEAD/DEAH box helicase family protein [Lachnospiraceae bacterium]
MTDYKTIMYNFSAEALRNYLGDNVISTLIEWLPNGKSSLSKRPIIHLIDLIYGFDILKDRTFRENLLLHDNNADFIFELRDKYLQGEEKQEADPKKIANIISKKPWGKNNITYSLLEYWEVPTNILDRPASTDVCYSNISAGERFYELLDYQYYIMQRALNILNSNDVLQRMLIHMPTGTGKTKTTMHIVTNYINFTLHKRGLVIWIAHTKELLQQAYATFQNVWEHLGDGDISAYKIWGDKDFVNTASQINGVAFIGLSKLMSIAKNNVSEFERIKKDCRLIIFDEAHKAAADETRTVIESLMCMPNNMDNRALIGLTATPGRSTDESSDNTRLTNMFSNRKIGIDAEVINQMNMGRLEALNTDAETNIIKYFQKRRILSKLHVERLEYIQNFSEAELEKLRHDLAVLENSGRDEYSVEQLKVLASNKTRNLEILRRLRRLNYEGIPTIVFACNVMHAKMLSAMLKIDDIPNSLVLGDMQPIDREMAINNFKDRSSPVNIIINYDVLTTGFDSTNIRCVFITRPTKSIILYSQMIGRGLRGPLMGGNDECLLIDVKDNIESFDSEEAFGHFNDYWA